MSRLPPLKSLMAFEAVARLLSVTKAAEELDVTQSAVSQQIRTLETALEYPVFTRQNQGLALTAKGKQLAPMVRNGFATIQQAVEKNAWREQNVRVGADMEYLSQTLMPSLAGFQHEHPSLKIWAQPLDANQAMPNDIDLAIAPKGSTLIKENQTLPVSNSLEANGLSIIIQVDRELSSAADVFLKWIEAGSATS